MALTFQAWLNRDISFPRSKFINYDNDEIVKPRESMNQRINRGNKMTGGQSIDYNDTKFNRLVQFVRSIFSFKNHRLTPLNLIACILSTCGLIWQVWQVSSVYFDYQTRVDIIISIPEALVIPGLTVCLDIVPNKTLLSSYFPGANFTSATSTFLASSLTYLPINVLASMNTVNLTFDCKTSVPEDQLANISDACESFSPVKVTIQSSARYDTVRKCYTYFYNSNPKQDIQLVDVDARDFYTLQVHSLVNHSVTVYVHNPREIVPFEESDSFLFFTRQASRIVVTSSRVRTSLLPPPYRTNCVFYNETEYGRTGCIYACRLAEARKDCNRWPYNVPAPVSTSVPFRIRGRSCTSARRYSCSKQTVCANQCHNNWYTTSLTHLRDKKDPNDAYTRFSVRRPLGIQFQYLYGPRLDAIEFLCYVASSFGMWMGISVFDLTLLTISWTRKRIPKRPKKIHGVVILK
ncbi:uncharacterized protein LOC128389170 [Panonychus citri]|uniref:uncharacterized protein LOC128389170 n=1 Tax=Panonychus citri TaxID=50023 RepID=UPI0023070C44|nr:uncharacterized protein LOC128389170 [Panonychus citri]